jgi:pilus assembly protein CpaE
MKNKTTVLLVEVLPKVAQRLRNFLEQISFIELIPGNITNSEVAIDTIRQTKPDVVLLELDLPGMNGIQCTDIIRRDSPTTQVVILSEVSSAETVRLAMRAGASDFLNYKNLTFEELESVVERAADLADQEKMRIAYREPVREKPIEEKPEAPKLGKVISIYSPKGGAGVSTIVANLGYALKAMTRERKVILVDLDLQFGDIGILYNQITNRSIMDIAIRAQNLDDDLVENVIFNDQPTKVDLMAAPYRLEIDDVLTGSVASQILEHMRHMYDYIIINNNSYITEATLATMGISDLIVLVGIQQVATIRSIRSFLGLANELRIPRERIFLVMNRFDNTSTITSKKVSDMININVAHTIPLDAKTAEKAANLGIPYAFDSSRLEISKSIFTLAEQVRNRVTEKEKA